jgi:hypothetical protein
VSDIFELWSQPWHALQRSLADSFRAEAPSDAGLNLRSSGGRAVPAPASSSWLLRARLSAMQGAAQPYR